MRGKKSVIDDGKRYRCWTIPEIKAMIDKQDDEGRSPVELTFGPNTYYIVGTENNKVVLQRRRDGITLSTTRSRLLSFYRLWGMSACGKEV